MIWIDNDKIQDLQYYHQGAGQYCYCDLILFPNDLSLQAQISQVNSSVSVEIHAYSVDGLTDLGDFTTYFDWYVTSNNGKYYWSCNLREIYPLCSIGCFLLRVTISKGTSIVWDKFTEQYCIETCCIPVTQITYTQEGYAPAIINGGSDTFGYKINSCGNNILVFIGGGTCFNSANGYYYGVGTKIAGNVDELRFYLATNLYATAEILPREIIRTISRNCRPQEVERTTKYKIQGQEEFPLWKMRDLEDLFSSENIVAVTDSVPEMRDVVLNTATPFERIGRRHVDQKYDRFKLNVEVSKCREFQLFGCGECSTTTNTTYAFVAPASTENYYNEGGQFIGTTPDDVIGYLRSIDQTTDAQLIMLSPPSSAWNIFAVAGLGYLPTAIYANSYNYENKIPAIIVTDDTIYSDLIPTASCGEVEIGVVVSETMTCESVEIGTITSETIGVEEAQLIQYGDWEIYAPETSMEKQQYVVSFDINVYNPNYPMLSSSPVIYPDLIGEIIGVIPYPCRPSYAQTFNHNNYSSIPIDATITVQSNGYIIYNGKPSESVPDGSYVTLTNILYNL